MSKITVFDVEQAVGAFAPPDLSAAWDNSGFLVGNLQQEVKGILVALDITQEVIEEAIAGGCNLLITHHPLIFAGLKQVLAGDFVGEMLQLLIKNDIAVIAAHTNLDSAPQGVNFALAEALGLSNITKISSDGDNENPSFMGDLAVGLNRQDLIRLVKKSLQIDFVKATQSLQNQEATYKKVAVCGGAGADLWQDAKAAGADCLLTAEGKHHIGLAAAYSGMLVIDGGHFGTEKIIVPILAAYLQSQFPRLKVGASARENDPWEIL